MRGAGSQLWRSPDGTVDSYERLANIMDLSLPEMTRGATDITPIDVADDTKKYEAGMADIGDGEFNLLFDATDTTQSTVEADFDSGDTVYYKVLFRDGSIALFQGFINKLGIQVPKEESVLRSVGIKGSGKLVTSATDTTVS